MIRVWPLVSNFQINKIFNFDIGPFVMSPTISNFAFRLGQLSGITLENLEFRQVKKPTGTLRVNKRFYI